MGVRRDKQGGSKGGAAESLPLDQQDFSEDQGTPSSCESSGKGLLQLDAAGGRASMSRRDW